MIKFITLVVAGIFSFSATGHAICDDLKQGLKVSFVDVPQSVKAGDNVRFKVKFELSQPTLLDDWENVSAQVRLGNSLSGSRSLHYFPALKEQGEVQPLIVEIDDTIPGNFVGQYSFKGSVFARGGTGGFCAGNLSDVEEATINVVNDSAAADIDPPVVTRLHADYPTYVSGQRVVISFLASDKSPICTADKKEAKQCDAVWHVETVHNESGETYNYYNPVLKGSRNRIETYFYIPIDAPAGKYTVTGINVDDIHGNASASIPNAEQIAFEVADNSALKDFTANIVESMIDPNQGPSTKYLGAVVGVIKDGKRYVFGFGQKDIETNERPSASDFFEIGSVTKAFTGLTLATQVIAGKVTLEAPASEYLPGVSIPELNGRKITLKDLATHSSGLPRVPSNLSPQDPLNPYAGYTRADLYNFLQNHELSADPGSVWDYSNAGAGLLGHIIATAANQPFEDLVISTVALPLNLYDTRIILNPQQNYRFLKGHKWDGEVTPRWTFDPDYVLAGLGALRSTPQDMLQFADANITPSSASIKDAIELSQTQHSLLGPSAEETMGLGWIRNRDTIWHNGSTYGFRSYIAIDNAADIAVLVLTNSMLLDDTGSNLDGRPEEAGIRILEYLRK